MDVNSRLPVVVVQSPRLPEVAPVVFSVFAAGKLDLVFCSATARELAWGTSISRLSAAQSEAQLLYTLCIYSPRAWQVSDVRTVKRSSAVRE